MWPFLWCFKNCPNLLWIGSQVMWCRFHIRVGTVRWLGQIFFFFWGEEEGHNAATAFATTLKQNRIVVIIAIWNHHVWYQIILEDFRIPAEPLLWSLAEEWQYLQLVFVSVSGCFCDHIKGRVGKNPFIYLFFKILSLNFICWLILFFVVSDSSGHCHRRFCIFDPWASRFCAHLVGVRSLDWPPPI